MVYAIGHVCGGHLNPTVTVGLFAGGLAPRQLWLFWVAPILGAAAAGVVYRTVGGGTNAEPVPVVGDA
ncbi:MAG TPA: hypothetical protein VE309_09495 [Caulobacteraceae bacterium]|nr:hypothetical protein [Caulobacteraceae bacterium]